MRRTATVLGAAVLAAAALSACRQKPVLVQTFPSTTAPETTTAPATTAPPTSAAASPTARALRRQAPIQGCVNGWAEPAPGTTLRQTPLDLLRGTQGFTGTFQVVDLRYFTGPDDANLAPESRQKDPVERWYGKVVYAKDPSFKIRFLAVRRHVGVGVVAVAPYASKDFASPDWHGFDGEGGHVTIPGVPGHWPGPGYDYVKAHALPDDVVGCLAD